VIKIDKNNAELMLIKNNAELIPPWNIGKLPTHAGNFGRGKSGVDLTRKFAGTVAADG
jgi:hypothetical protein